MTKHEEDSSLQRLRKLTEELTNPEHSPTLTTDHFLRELISNLPFMAWVKEVGSWKFVYTNDFFCEWFQVTQQQVLGATDRVLFDDPSFDEMTSKYRLDDEWVASHMIPLRAEETVNLKSGPQRVVTFKVPIILGDEKYVGGVAIVISSKGN